MQYKQDQQDIGKQARLKVLLGLGLQSKNSEQVVAPENNCPDEESIACYFDNTLTVKENKEFINSLVHCPQSYSLWLDMAETLDYTLEQASRPIQDKAKKVTIFTYLNSLFSQHQIALSGAVATTFLLVMAVSFSFTPFTQLPLDKQIVKVWENEEVLDLAYIDITEFIPKASTKSGFNVMPFPEKIAFSSGFKQGLIKMSSISQTISSDNQTLNFLNSLPDEAPFCKRKTCAKENTLNKQLGIWSSFVLQQCQQNKESPVRYWEKQNIVIKHFLSEYEKMPDLNAVGSTHQGSANFNHNTLVSRVNHISESLQRLSEDNPVSQSNNQLIACNSIKQMTLYSIQGL